MLTSKLKYRQTSKENLLDLQIWSQLKLTQKQMGQPVEQITGLILCTYELVVDEVLAEGEGGYEVPAVAHGQLDEALPWVQFNRHL